MIYKLFIAVKKYTVQGLTGERSGEQLRDNLIQSYDQSENTTDWSLWTLSWWLVGFYGISNHAKSLIH